MPICSVENYIVPGGKIECDIVGWFAKREWYILVWPCLLLLLEILWNNNISFLRLIIINDAILVISNRWQLLIQRNNICKKKRILNKPLGIIFNSNSQKYFFAKKFHTFSLKRYLKFHVRNSFYINPQKIIPSLFSLGVKEFLLNTKINIDFESQIQLREWCFALQTFI